VRSTLIFDELGSMLSGGLDLFQRFNQRQPSKKQRKGQESVEALPHSFKQQARPTGQSNIIHQDPPIEVWTRTILEKQEKREKEQARRLKVSRYTARYSYHPARRSVTRFRAPFATSHSSERAWTDQQRKE
jgi:hypothetical protein